jgi:DNA-binding NarL/FixJ family response regulator
VAQRAVLIIEDDPNWQSIFREIVADCGFRPVVVASYHAALRVLTRQTFTLAIVDISLSAPDYADRSGVEVLRVIAAASTRLPAIVVTGYATVDLAIETLVDLDAVNFFRKDNFDRREFSRIVKKEAASASTQAYPAAVLELLSEREQEVLALLIQGQTNRQIAESLTITVNTVKKHVQSIFTKLNVETRAAAVAKALSASNKQS